MISLLAQASRAANDGAMDNLFQTVVHMFSRADTLARPETLVGHLQALSVVWAVVFMIVGTLCLLSGYKFYRIVTVCLALLIGMFAGYWLGSQIQAPYVVAGCLGVLMAGCVFPLMKFAVALFGGLAGAFIGANLWAGIAHAINQATQANMPVDAYWVGALVGLILCGMLAFILFELSIVLFTSVSGATIAVLGTLALLLSFEPWRETVTQGLEASRLIIPMLVFVPALIGLILQEFWSIQTRQGGASAAKA